MIRSYEKNKQGKKPVITFRPPRSSHAQPSDQPQKEELDDTMPHQQDDEVSVSSDLEMTELEEIINGSNPNVIEKLTIDSNKEVSDITGIIDAEYCVPEVSVELPPVDSRLAEVLSGWLKNLPSREMVKEQFQKCMLPSNVDGLQPAKINEFVYDKLPSNYKFNDQRLRGINTFFARGLGPIVHVWDKILKWEAKLRQGMCKTWISMAQI